MERFRSFLFAITVLASPCFSQGVFEETSDGVRVGMKYRIGNITNANLSGEVLHSVAPFGHYTNGNTINVKGYAWRNVGTNGNRVYSAISATNSTLTSNADFIVKWTWTGVPGSAGYLFFGSINGGPATNWIEQDSGTLEQYINFGPGDWTTTPRDNPPVPVSPFFLGAEVLNTGTNALVTNTPSSGGGGGGSGYLSDSNSITYANILTNGGAQGKVLTYDAGSATAIWSNAPAGGSQTPWASDIDGGGFSLGNVLAMDAMTITAGGAAISLDGASGNGTFGGTVSAALLHSDGDFTIAGSIDVGNNLTINSGANALNADGSASFASGTATIDSSGNLDVASAIVDNDLHVFGKTTSDGGIDPPYFLLDRNTKADFLSRYGREVPPEKRSGLAMFYDGTNLFGYVGTTGKLYQIGLTEVGSMTAPEYSKPDKEKPPTLKQLPNTSVDAATKTKKQKGEK